MAVKIAAKQAEKEAATKKTNANELNKQHMFTMPAEGNISSIMGNNRSLIPPDDNEIKYEEEFN